MDESLGTGVELQWEKYRPPVTRVKVSHDGQKPRISPGKTRSLRRPACHARGCEMRSQATFGTARARSTVSSS